MDRDEYVERRLAAIAGSISGVLTVLRELTNDVSLLVIHLREEGRLPHEFLEELEPSLSELDSLLTRGLEHFQLADPGYLAGEEPDP